MTIEEAEKIMILNDQRSIPLSNNLTSDEEERVLKLCIVNAIKFLFKPKMLGMIKNKVHINVIKQNPLVESFTIPTDKTEPYILKTKFGEGRVFDIYGFFNNKKLPSCIKPNKCFYNARIAAVAYQQAGVDCKQMTGIMNYYRTVLHSVVVFKGKKPKVLDFTFNAVMDYDLYMKLTSFEIFNEIDGKDLVDEEKDKLLSAYNKSLKQKGKKLDYGVIALAYDDIIAQVENMESNIETKTV